MKRSVVGELPIRVGFRCLLALLLSACSLSTAQVTVEPIAVYVGQVDDFASGSVTPLNLPATFPDPDPAPLGSETPGVVIQPPVATVSPIPVYLIRGPEDHFRALLARDPFRGCRVRWREASQEFVDPCHGSRYTAEGIWLEGPSPRNLDGFGVVVSTEGDVWVDVDQYWMGARHP